MTASRVKADPSARAAAADVRAGQPAEGSEHVSAQTGAPEAVGWEPELAEIRRRRGLAQQMGGAEKVTRQHANGRLTVRERIERLLDPDSFCEIGSLAGFTDPEDGSFSPANIVIGTGRVDARKVVLYGDDFTIRGGAGDAAILAKQVYAEQLARELQLPLVRLIEGTGGGGSVRVLDEQGYTYVPVNPGWDHVVENLSLVPVVGVVLGPVAGLGAARAVAAHWTIMVKDSSQLFVAGPPVVRYGTGEQVDKQELGGAAVHGQSGAVDLVADSEDEALEKVRRFLSYLPASVHGLPPIAVSGDPVDRREDVLRSIVPRNRRRAYDVREIIAGVFDRDSILEYAGYGGALITVLARLDGRPVGVVASDARRSGGALTSRGADALIRFVDLCETFHLPIVSLTDQPGALVGTAGERAGTIRHAVRAIFAVYQARVPAAEVILRRVFGVGGAGMSNRHRLTRRWAWPSADWGSLPVQGGVEAAYKAQIEAAPDPAAEIERIRARLEEIRSPVRTAERFGIEEIIDPCDTRRELCEWVHDAYALLPQLLGPPSHGTRP